MIPKGTERPKNKPLEPTVAADGSPGKTPDDRLLQNIQGNILKSHGRPYTRLVLFWFDDDRPNPARLGLFPAACEAGLVTSAYKQWSDTQTAKANWRAAHPAGPAMPLVGSGERFGPEPFYSVGLSLSGMRCCGYVNDGDLPLQGTEGEGGFTNSMRSTFHTLEEVPPGDPDWDPAYRDGDGPHGVWLLAHENHQELDAMRDRVVRFLLDHGAGRGRAPVIEDGMNWTDAQGQTREPFGFRDGLSVPPFFADDFEKDRAGYFTSKWVNLPRSQILIGDEADQSAQPSVHDGGSFLVLRKLDQNVAAFRQWEADTGVSGALLVGRQRDGTPLQALTAARPALNNFSFDQSASRCPFHAHIRKASPRIAGKANDAESMQTELDQRATLFVRRSAVYGIDVLPKSGTLPPDQITTYLDRQGQPIAGGVGLLFMAYMSSIKSQFLVLQRNWFGNLDFPFTNTELGDPLLRPAAARPGQVPPPWAWPKHGAPHDLKKFVTTRGGAYFYVPPISWLRRPPEPSV